ncbi:phosphopantetheine-binding protein [Mycoplasmopsis arginini]|uniref:Phosphopantetheine-binding protein n=1 Tax=Mycoplasmopsis arginini TaxID=2094 RepID=A0ABZ2AJ57_MYCAR|nr:phosphopantetheine-binding protein [Mycoplasmopsis arginini]CRH45944.1 acyl carrier protein [Chlamydia trachomatis]SGA03373.1 acyl carrier protein [Chlamydia abortus]ENY69993.1 Putative acyl carrier protein [Mycoplasmopsis arginini 7264]MDI3348377.1 Acyl carrier protein [Mycoplasmopsis arginini]MDI3348881.1 Acyl carrier protein [Mycoplasmopsis arginini]
MNFQDIVFKELKKLTKKPFDLDTLIKDLNIDSLDLVLLVSDLESKFKIEIKDEELMNLKTINDIIDIINQKYTK